MTSNRTSAVQSPLRFNVCGMGFLGGVEVSNIDADSVYLNLCQPSSTIAVSPKQSRPASFMGTALIVCVSAVAYFAQIAYSVVQRVSVNVVKYWAGWGAIKMQPSDPVGVMSGPVDLDYYSPSTTDPANRTVKLCRAGVLNSARKPPGFMVIVEKLAHPLCREWRGFLWNGRIAQVVDPVVTKVLVSVDDALSRERAMYVQPRKGMGRVLGLANADDDSAGASGSSGNGADRDGAVNLAPRKYAGVWAIVQKLLEPILSQGKLISSHAVSPLKKWFGQKPARVISTGGLRHFSTGVA